jgi:hypothetical protein
VTAAQELATLFARDLARLHQQIEGFGGVGEAALWKTLPGVTNSAGNLALHLEGNLREYIGRQLGGIAYTRTRPYEFSATGLPLSDVTARIVGLESIIPGIVAGLSGDALSATYPENVLGEPVSTRHLLIHLHGHLTYHLGQINYLRRLLL